MSVRKSYSNDFNGECMDTGSQRAVVGKPQAEEYYHLIGITALIKTYSWTLFKFGKKRVASIGKVKLRVQYADNMYIDLNVGAVEIDVPFIFGLDAMDKYSFHVNNVDNLIV